MIYRFDDLIESRDFEHDQKFVKAEHWKEACSEADEDLKSVNYLKERVKDLEQKLSDSESDWLKMREIAEETQRKLEEGERRNSSLIEEAKKELSTKDKRIAYLESECSRLFEPTKKFWNDENEKKLAESQATLREAIEVIKTLLEIHGEAEVNEPWELARSRDFLAKIKGKKDEPCNHQWQYFASGHAQGLIS